VKHVTVRVLIDGLAGDRPMTGIEGLAEGSLVLRAGTGALREGTAVKLPQERQP
jgi:hypothetical protein